LVEHCKIKVKLSLFAMQVTRGGEYSPYSFLTSTLDRDWSASRSGRALPLGKEIRHQLHRRLSGLRAGVDIVATRKILSLCRGSNSGSPVCSQTL
jgi:hypothetical protein